MGSTSTGAVHQPYVSGLPRRLVSSRRGLGGGPISRSSRRPAVSRLILTAPPQHGKSELISRRLPAFALGRNPNLQIIATSYSADRAFDFSANVQQIMDADAYHAVF